MTTFSATLRQAFSQIGRNRMMAAASLFSITAILLVLGVFFLIVVNIGSMSQDVKRNFDQIQIDLYDSVTVEQSAKMMEQLTALAGVAGASYQTRETALENWKEKWGDNADLLDRIPTNPLPNSIIVDLSDISHAQAVVGAAREMLGVENISYSQDTVDKLLRITRIVQWVSLIIILALVAISITVVSNTIKLTVLAREREIVIMRYIGATNWFIRGPFLLEGVVIGAISAVVSAVVIAFLYQLATQRLGVDFALLMPTGFVPLRFMVENLLIIFVCLGVSIGACGSLVSMRRFLER